MANLLPPSLNLLEFIKERVKEFRNKIFLRQGEFSITYREFDATTDQMAAALQALDLKKGDHVAVLFPNSLDTLFSYFSIIKAGGTVIPINPVYTPREMAFILSNAEAKILLAAASFRERILEIKNQTPFLSQIIFREETDLSIFSVLKKWASSPSALKPVDLTPEDKAIIFYTSGTLGQPKGVILTHGNFSFSGPNIAQAYGLKENDITVAVLPLVHVFALASPVFGSLSSGGTVVIMERFQAENVLQAIAYYGITWFPGVPTMFNYLYHAYEKIGVNIKTLRMGLSGGASLSVGLLKNWEQRFGAFILEVYGLTESTGLVTANPVQGKRKPGSIGLTVPHVRVRLIDQEGKEVKPGEVGELIFKGPNATTGYWKIPQLTAESIREGWVYTGDLAKQDEDNFYYIVGRKKELIITGGYNVYPREIEEVLYMHPAIYEAAVIGIPDELKGEVPKAFITLHPGQNISANEVIEFCKQYLAPYKIPKQVEIRKDLPKSSTGKILHRELKGLKNQGR